MNQSRFGSNRQVLRDKIVIGTDPAKHNHRGAVVDASGNQRGKSFTFPVSAESYRQILWRRVSKILTAYQPTDAVFAIETSTTSSKSNGQIFSFLKRCFEQWIVIDCRAFLFSASCV
jgi:hypothetical protein